jgi:hypothetical protein
MGVKYKPSEGVATPSELLDELVESYSTASAKVADTFEGILISIDEADKPPVSANLGALLKGFTERLARTSPNTICLGVAGVTSVLNSLRESHESALRLFTNFHLKPLSRDESIEIVRKGLSVAREKSGISVSITPEAEQFIAGYSEGYPHFVQQFAYCAFEADTDNSIDTDDVTRGAWGEHGAFEQLGTKYFEGMYFDKIKSDDYRRVLMYMAEKLDGWVSKEEIRAHSNLKATTLNNAVKAMVDRHIILPQQGKRGMYRLPLMSFAVWIRAYTSFPEAPTEK